MFISKDKIEIIYRLLKKYPLSKIINMKEYREYMPYLIISKLIRTYPNDKDLLIKIKEFYLEKYKMPDRILIISDNHLGRLVNDEYYDYRVGIKKKLYSNEEGLVSAYN